MNPFRSAMLMVFVLGAHGTSVAAHDFWVQPNEYWIPTDAVIPLTLQVGHGPLRQRSPIPIRRIARFQAFDSEGVVIDLRGHLTPGQATEDGEIRFNAPGDYVLVLQTDNHALSQLPSIRFNDYIKVEGLTPALEERTRQHRMDSDGSERYSRCAKSLVHVGKANQNDHAHFSKPIGLPLEIVTETNPYEVPRPAALLVRVIYAGQPLAGALVKLTDLKDDGQPREVHLTDQAGHANFAMPSAGSWLLNVIWTRPLPANEDTDFETVFSSLTFGLPPPQT